MAERKTYTGRMELKADGQPGDFRAIFATLQTIDHDKDVTLAGAFQEGQAVRISAWGHKWDELPVGMGEIHADAKEAWVDGRFFVDTASGKEHYTTVKAMGPLAEWSYGFEVLDSAPGQFDGQDVRFLRKMKVIEVSPVMQGAGINTRTVDIKADKATMRTEADGDHPASHYLVVEDPETVTTWHLRVRAMNGDPDHRLMGAAWAALHGGYRGNVYEGPGKAAAIAKLTAMYSAEGMDVPKADWNGETKAGRVLARRNAERIMAALETLNEVLKDAGLLETADSDSDHDGDDGATDKTRKGTPKEPQSSTLAARVALDLMENE
jgi:hypothetical protein